MLLMVDVIGFGRGKEDAFDTLAAQQARQEIVSPRAEGRQDRGHRLPHVLDCGGAFVDRAKRIDKHDLPVDAGKVVAKERFDHPCLVGLKPARAFPCKRPAWCIGRGQRRKGQNRRTIQIAGQQEAPGRAIGKSGLARVLQVFGEFPCQSLGNGFLKRCVRVGVGQRGKKPSGLRPVRDPVQHVARP